MSNIKSTQYDLIGAKYENMNDLPAHAPLYPTIDKLIGAIRGRHVLDLACGSGHWTRILAEMGASKVIGCDISEGMIDDARKSSRDCPNVEYHMADCSKPMDESNGAQLAGQFDVAFAAWFLNYAGNAEELAGMWSNVYSSLKPNGRLVAIVPNLENDLREPLDPRYGTYLYAVKTINEGSPDEGQLCHMKAFTQPPVEFDCYRLSKSVFELTAKAAGMRNIEWHHPVIPKAGWPQGYWDVYEKRPHFLVCLASKPADADIGAHL